MPSKLVESIPGTDAPAGLGFSPGFGFGWGADAPLHAWYMWPPALLFGVGQAFMSIGAYARDWPGGPNSMLSAMRTVAALDYINQDQTEWGVGNIFSAYGTEGLQPSALPSDVQIPGSHTTYPVPMIFGGNAVRVAVGVFNPGVEYPAGVGVITAGVQKVVMATPFEPDLVLFFGENSNGASGDSGRFMFGVMDAAGNQWVCAEWGIFGSAALIIGGAIGQSTRYSEFRSDACTLSLTDSIGSPGGATNGRVRCSFNAMNADGFSLNVDESNPTQGGTLYMALKVLDPSKGFFKVGNHVQGDTVGESGLGITPGGVILCGDSWSDSVDGATPDPSGYNTGGGPSSRAVVSLGGFDDATQRASCSGCPTGTANPKGYYDDSAIIFGDTQAETTLARALAAITADGWTLDWTDDDGGARPFGSITFQAPNSGLPVLRNGYYLHQAPSVDGAGLSGEVDDGDPTAAEGIVIALQDDTLEMGQTWTDVDAT